MIVLRCHIHIGEVEMITTTWEKLLKFVANVHFVYRDKFEVTPQSVPYLAGDYVMILYYVMLGIVKASHL